MKPESITARRVLMIASVCLLTVSACGGRGGDIPVSIAADLTESSAARALCLYLVDQDPNVVHMRLKLELPRVRHAEQLRAYRQRMLEVALAETVIATGSEPEFRDLADGTYWVVSLDPLASGDLLLFWASPARVEGGSSPGVRLALSNAALILDKNECDLN